MRSYAQVTFFITNCISLLSVKFDVNIVELAAATGTDRTHLVAQLQERLADKTILEASLLLDQNGRIFRWLFPSLLTSEEHVSRPLITTGSLLICMASQHWWAQLWKRKMHCESVTMHRGEPHRIDS